MPNKKIIVKKNSTPNSMKEVLLNTLTFKELWDNYPSGNPYENSTYKDQCAIRMSVTFHRVGIEMKSFSSKLVHPQSGQPSIGRIILDGKITATRADELGEWLRLRPFVGLPDAEDITGSEWAAKVKGRTGIIQFSRYWTRDGESTADASGGHIDLWNGARLTISGPIDSIATVSRMFGISSLFSGYSFGFSDLRNSKKILFWEIK
ncbi:type VI secretion system amidase effector protein Tae4 [Paraburkholderia caballeronis]|uniref:type VI secretion system amidase effector protein Tae4 n=1 Tax=Paraburkholderia caballeronis TaxID=416943 RepID=UPI0010662027|nr:type VI secretion system amidase effector protein Tae4 [Paraburkholderia caballeronis]TDV15578.1 type VI secretion system (T6SS) effector Tae4 (amidase) [Paraburkholderia caballeronis]TDV17833.1 type VI secretion system (T6SS) effector Tae4 (amidase) [Paraburkholderia caballeronis]TDV26553.1 type VI secretion system (T6SS) effector Tae4 (amidase) [Paraburkholderia caballeronis]